MMRLPKALTRISVVTWLAVAGMTAAMVYTQLGAGMHWWLNASHSTYEIENYGFPYIAIMQNWMTDLMAEDFKSRIEVWDWYPWSFALDIPIGLLAIGSTGVVVERVIRSRGQASLAGILAITTTIAALVAIWLNAPAILALLRSGPPYIMQFNQNLYVDMPKWLQVAWTIGVICIIDTGVLTIWKVIARATGLAGKSDAAEATPNKQGEK